MSMKEEFIGAQAALIRLEENPSVDRRDVETIRAFLARFLLPDPKVQPS